MAQQKSTNFFDPQNNPFLDPKTNPFLDPKNNPFLDSSKNPFLNADISQMFGAYQAPQMDSLMASQRKNFEALAEANKTAVEGLQAVFARQAEILKESMDEVNAALHSLNAGDKPDAAAAQNIDQIKEALDGTIANMRELSEMVSKSQTESVEILNKRLAASLDELKTAVSQSQEAAQGKSEGKSSGAAQGKGQSKG